MTDVLAYISMVGVLLGYALSDRFGKHLIDTVNALFFIPLMVAALHHNAIPAAFMNLFFGIIAIRSLYVRR